jgi:hypothetical protein
MTPHDTAGPSPGAAVTFGAAERRLLIARQLDRASARLAAITGDAAGLRARDGDGR